MERPGVRPGSIGSDNWDSGPAELPGAIGEPVFTALALLIVQELIGCRLTDIDARASGQMPQPTQKAMRKDSGYALRQARGQGATGVLVGLVEGLAAAGHSLNTVSFATPQAPITCLLGGTHQRALMRNCTGHNVSRHFEPASGPGRVLIIAHIPLDFVAKGSMCGTRKEGAALDPETSEITIESSLAKAPNIAKAADTCIIQQYRERPRIVLDIEQICLRSNDFP